MFANIFPIISYEKPAQVVFEISYNLLVTFCNGYACVISLLLLKKYAHLSAGH